MQESLTGTKAGFGLMALAGLHAVNLKVFWQPGMTAPAERDRLSLENLAAASRLSGYPVYISISSRRGLESPSSMKRQDDFVQFETALARQFPHFTKFIVHREANLNYFWQPQFGPKGRDAAAYSYERLLARSYDALKAVSPAITVIGGGLAPRGHDDPNNSSLSHSPVRFIRDLGQAYRQSGRETPIADWWAHHPYQNSRKEAPRTIHAGTNISLGDYPKLILALRRAFEGTAQAWQLPIVYDEYGIESSIPEHELAAYTHTSWVGEGELPSPAEQGQLLAEAIETASRQRRVRAMFLFLLVDQPNMGGWQSGLYYANLTPKPSLSSVRHAIQALTEQAP